MQKLLIYEGISYVLMAGIISFCAGNLFSRIVLGTLNHVILFFEYQFTIAPFVFMLGVLLLTAVVTPVIVYRRMQKHSIVKHSEWWNRQQDTETKTIPQESGVWHLFP